MLYLKIKLHEAVADIDTASKESFSASLKLKRVPCSV